MPNSAYEMFWNPAKPSLGRHPIGCRMASNNSAELIEMTPTAKDKPSPAKGPQTNTPTTMPASDSGIDKNTSELSDAAPSQNARNDRLDHNAADSAGSHRSPWE